MFQAVSDLSESVQALNLVAINLCGLLTELVQLSSDKGNLQVRVDELERGRDQWEARTEAELLRSESGFKSARAAEERARTMQRHAEALAGDEDGEAGTALQHIRELLQGDAQAGAPGELPAVQPDLALSSKTLARMAKFGVNNG